MHLHAKSLHFTPIIHPLPSSPHFLILLTLIVIFVILSFRLLGMTDSITYSNTSISTRPHFDQCSYGVIVLSLIHFYLILLLHSIASLTRLLLLSLPLPPIFPSLPSLPPCEFSDTFLSRLLAILSHFMLRIN